MVLARGRCFEHGHGVEDILTAHTWSERWNMNDVAVFGHDHHDGLGRGGPLVPDGGVVARTSGWIAFALSVAVKDDADCEADALRVDEYGTVDVREVREQGQASARVVQLASPGPRDDRPRPRPRRRLR